MKYEILLEVGDFLPRIPPELLHAGPHDTGCRLKFDAAELADRMGRGETTILLTEIHRRAPEIFLTEIHASNDVAIRFPWQKVAHLVAAARLGPGSGSDAGGLTPAVAEFLAERLRGLRDARKLNPGPVETKGIPFLVAPPAPAPKNPAGESAAVEKPAAPREPAPEASIPAQAAPTPSAATTGTEASPPPYDDGTLSREDLLRARETLRVQLARTKSEFARQLAVAWDERQKMGAERERFIAEMMRANKVAAERGEQIDFEKSAAAKRAEILAKAEEDAGTLHRELSTLHRELAKAQTETNLIIEELIAERATLTKGQPLAAHQLARLQKRHELALKWKEAAREVALRPSREIPRPPDASKSPAATAGQRNGNGAGHSGEKSPVNGRGAAPVRRPVFAPLVRFAILAGLLGAWGLQLLQHDRHLAGELRTLDREWAGVSAALDKARVVKADFERSLRGTMSARAEFDGKDRWTPALRSIVTSAGEGIELRAIQVLKKPDDPRADGLRIEGVAVGPEPRVIADEFLQALQRELRRHFPAAGPGQFERLEDDPEPPADDSEQWKANFTITAPIGAAIPPAGEPTR